jgi:phage-related minor tail protein
MALKLGELATVLKGDLDPLRKDLAKGKQYLQEHGSEMKAAALAAGAAIGVALGSGVVGAMNVEAANDKLAAQLGATGKEAEDLGKIAGNLYANAFGSSMEEVTAAVAAVTTSIDDMAGDQAVEDMTAKVLNLAAAFEIDVARAAQVAGQVVKSGLAKDSTQAVDLITASLQQVPAAVRDDLMDALDEYGPFLASIGVQGEQAFGLLVKGAEKGMYGIDKTGDALKEFTIRATDMSTASKVGYDLLGMSQEKMSAALLKGGKTGEDAFNKIIAGLQGIKDPVKQSQAALALFGTPLEDLSVAEIPAFLASLSNAESGLFEVQGAADRMGETLGDNAATTLESFKRQAQAALVEKMAAAVPYLQAVGSFLSQHSAIVGPLAVGLGAFAVAVYAVVTAMKIWAAIQVVLNLALWTSPITWIVLGIIALVAAVVLIATKTDWFQRLWGAAWGGIKAQAARTMDFLQGLPGKIGSAFAKVGGLISAPFKAGFNAISRFWNSTVGKLSFTVPGWVPGMGGNGFSMPNLPQLAKGGTALAAGMAIVGENGPELAYLGRGATIQPLDRGGAGGGISVLRLIVAYPDGRKIKDELINTASDYGQTVESYLGIA